MTEPMPEPSDAARWAVGGIVPDGAVWVELDPDERVIPLTEWQAANPSIGIQVDATAAVRLWTARLWAALEEHVRYEAVQQRRLGQQYRRRQLARRRRRRTR